MNLAYYDVRRHGGRFLGTAFGLGLLFAVVLAMAGIYAGLLLDATSLSRTMSADLWVVQNGTRGPFADASRIDPSIESRVATVPGVATARAYTYTTLQRSHKGKDLRFATVGLAWPTDKGEGLPLIMGRSLAQAHGEAVADVSLGLGIGETIELASELYVIVGLTSGVRTTGGDPALFVSVRDSHLVAFHMPAAAIMLERERALARLQASERGRSQPSLEQLITDPRIPRPVLADPSVHAILVNLKSISDLQRVRNTLSSWPDVSVYTHLEEETFLLQGVIKKARVQLGLFSLVLTLTAGVMVAMVIYNMTVDKTHDIAVLKLMGTPTRRLAMMVLQQSWLLGLLSYLVALLLAEWAFPFFPRRTILTEEMHMLAPLLVFAVTTIGSVFGVIHALKVNVGRVLEG